jgi:hypothetical protein
LPGAGQINPFIMIGQPVSSALTRQSWAGIPSEQKPIDFSINFTIVECYGLRREERAFPGETARLIAWAH